MNHEQHTLIGGASNTNLKKRSLLFHIPEWGYFEGNEAVARWIIRALVRERRNS